MGAPLEWNVLNTFSLILVATVCHPVNSVYTWDNRKAFRYWWDYTKILQQSKQMYNPLHQSLSGSHILWSFGERKSSRLRKSTAPWSLTSHRDVFVWLHSQPFKQPALHLPNWKPFMADDDDDGDTSAWNANFCFSPETQKSNKAFGAKMQKVSE